MCSCHFRNLLHCDCPRLNAIAPACHLRHTSPRWSSTVPACQSSMLSCHQLNRTTTGRATAVPSCHLKSDARPSLAGFLFSPQDCDLFARFFHELEQSFFYYFDRPGRVLCLLVPGSLHASRGPLYYICFSPRVLYHVSQA